MPELFAEAFVQEHRRCGELESGMDVKRIWIMCECGAVLSRVTTPQTDARPPGGC